MTYETVIGLEVHAELSTKSKIFCGCSTAFGGEANTLVCPVCAGLPGSLPLLNRSVVSYAIKTGLALGCEITRDCKFDRKNYFYPDLPKAYQVSQLYAPICVNGVVRIETKNGEKAIRIREIHMEEDAGKLIHTAQGTLMDFNRCGVPLLEIVTQPDFADADEVVAYLVHLRETLLYLGVCDCKMQEGSLRCDVNLSIKEKGAAEPGTRTETKNLNSFKAIAGAIEYETERQTELIKKGGVVTQETRRWDDDAGVSYAMRSKEDAHDYRYFPEPDLLPIHIDERELAELRNSLPELPRQKRQRYMTEFGISQSQAAQLTAYRNINALFEETAELSKEPAEAANLITGEIMRLINGDGLSPEVFSIDAAKLAQLIEMVVKGGISRAAYKETVEAVYRSDVSPKEYIAENNLEMQTDMGALSGAVREAVEENPAAAADFRNGKAQAFGFLMGQVMRRLGASADPGAVKKALTEALNKDI